MEKKEDQYSAEEEALRTELKRHDWYYDYSDDGGVWRRGKAHRTQIDSMFAAFKARVGHGRAHALWNECAPKDFHVVEKGEAS
jgi:hypothetical protein